MTTLEINPSVRIGTAKPELVQARKLRPVVFWAWLGGIQLAVAAYALTRYSLNFPGTTPIGISKIPTAMMWNLLINQFLSSLGFLFFVYWFVVRAWRREGHLTLDGILVIAATLVYWQDYMLNWAQMVSTYNSGLMNWGSWYNFVPGWLPAHGNRFAEVPLWGGTWYAYGIVGVMMMFNFVMRRVKARYPNISTFRLVLVAFALGCFVDLVAELLWLYSGVYTYPGFGGPTLFKGHYYQFPMFEMFAWGSVWATFACFRFFKNDKGETWAERGIEEVRLGRKGKTTLRLVAIFGVLSSVVFVYNVALAYPTLKSANWPEDVLKRSYFTQGLCGAGTDRICSGTNLPVQKRGSATITPEGTIGHMEKLPAFVPHTKCPGSPLDAPLSGSC